MVSQVNVNSQEASIPYPCQQHEVVVQPDSLDDSDSRDEAQRDEDGGHDEDGDGDHQDGGSAILHLQRQRGDNRAGPWDRIQTGRVSTACSRGRGSDPSQMLSKSPSSRGRSVVDRSGMR